MIKSKLFILNDGPTGQFVWKGVRLGRNSLKERTNTFGPYFLSPCLMQFLEKKQKPDF